ncbi:hypothetical protein [Streptomyces niveus]
MGYELRRQLRESLGPDITGLQRAVALEIADDARHDADGRRSKASLKDLARWAGAKDTAVVRNALKRLAEAGWEFRLPIGKGRDGRVLYAVPGRAMEFRVPFFPDLPEGAPAHSDRKTEEGAGAHSEGAGAHSEGAGAHSEGAGATPPSHTTHHTSPFPADDAADDPSVDDREAQQQGQLLNFPKPATAKGSKRKSQKRQPKAAGEPNQHQVADELTKAFWDRHGKGRAQPYIAVRGVIRTAIGNGVERDNLARALDRVAREGRSISGATLDIALGSLKRTNTGPPTAPRHMTDEEKRSALEFG